MREKRSLFLYGVCVLALCLPLLGQQAQQASAVAPELEAEAKELEGMIIAPCCWTQPVADHYSGISWEIREEVRKMLAEGKSRQEVLDHYVAEYGRRILAAPERSGFDSLAYYLPVVFLIAGAGLCYVVVQKLRGRPTRQETPITVAKIDDRYSELLKREMTE